MGFLDFISKIFGNKSTRDLKEIQPWVDKVKAVYDDIAKLSDDELRAKTQSIRQYIQDYVATEKAEVQALRDSVEDKSLEEREVLWREIDKKDKAIF